MTMPAPSWLGGLTLPEPERGLRGERVVPYEAVAQAVAMADAALKAKTRAAQRSALAAASLGFQKGVAASQAAMAQQARRGPALRARALRCAGCAERGQRRSAWRMKRGRIALRWRARGRAFALLRRAQPRFGLLSRARRSVARETRPGALYAAPVLTPYNSRVAPLTRPPASCRTRRRTTRWRCGRASTSWRPKTTA